MFIVALHQSHKFLYLLLINYLVLIDFKNLLDYFPQILLEPESRLTQNHLSNNSKHQHLCQIIHLSEQHLKYQWTRGSLRCLMTSVTSNILNTYQIECITLPSVQTLYCCSKIIVIHLHWSYLLRDALTIKVIVYPYIVSFYIKIYVIWRLVIRKQIPFSMM